MLAVEIAIIKTFHLDFLLLSLITRNHAIGTVRKFPTLPLNANGVWIDPTGGVWRQATDVQNGMKSEGNVSAAAGATQAPPPQLPLPDYERFVWQTCMRAHEQ